MRYHSMLSPIRHLSVKTKFRGGCGFGGGSGSTRAAVAAPNFLRLSGCQKIFGRFGCFLVCLVDWLLIWGSFLLFLHDFERF